jgi:hypothetical protein
MRLTKTSITRKSKQSIAMTLLLLFSLPAFVLGLLQNESFDTRNKAFEDIQVSEQYPCVITFPNVNPYTLEVNRTVRVQVEALSKELGINSVTINDTIGNQLIQKSYDTPQEKLTESFLYTPEVAQAYNLSGKIIDTNNETYDCIISSPYSIQGLKAITENTKPSFTSSPNKDSEPSQNISVGTIYEYTIKAEDIDKDTINYSYSFTPGQDWLKMTVTEDGSQGKLSIKLKGAPQNPGSYLANIFIHDGYSKHLSSQSWVISVNPEGSEIPMIKIIEPIQPEKITEELNVIVSWESETNYNISRYEIFMSSNPANENSWIEINNNVSPTVSFYNIDLTNITDGTYRIIVRAVDTQTPPGIGMAISEEIIIAKEPELTDTPDDQIILPQPQIINVSPSSSDEVVNQTPTIRASLISSEGAIIEKSSIKVEIDGRDITTEVRINEISESEYTLIYIPEQSLSTGVHKVSVSFKDSHEKEEEKEWIFTISDENNISDEDSFEIFGFEVKKRTVYIIGGGLSLIVFAILLPMIIATIWKDKSANTFDENYALPKSIPSTGNEIPTQEKTPISQLTNEVFDAPEPILDLPKQTESIPSPPEPEEDLNTLQKEIEQLKKE